MTPPAHTLLEPVPPASSVEAVQSTPGSPLMANELTVGLIVAGVRVGAVTTGVFTVTPGMLSSCESHVVPVDV